LCLDKHLQVLTGRVFLNFSGFFINSAIPTRLGSLSPIPGRSKLGRDVAIKVLPKEFSEDEQRLGRFKREAKALAAYS